MRLVLLFLVLSAICGLNYAAKEPHNYYWGQPGPYDVLLYRGIHRQGSSFLRTVSENVTFPARNTTNVKVITSIRVFDQVSNGDGGYVSLYGGGVNYNHSVIHLKSQRNKGYNFIVEIHGRY